jgi:uncharacterized protein
MKTSNEKNISALIHLSSLSQYFIPFGNYIFPIILWSSKKNDSEFVDYNGKQVLNFQLSILLYSLIIALITIPILIYNVVKNLNTKSIDDCCNIVFDNVQLGNFTGIIVFAIMGVIIFGFMKIIEFVLIIYAAVKASNGEEYQYPLTIKFLK